MRQKTPRSQIVYFLEAPLDERDFQRFGIDFMLNLGIQVDVFVVSSISKSYLPQIPSITPKSPMLKIFDIGTLRELQRFHPRLSNVNLIVSTVGTSHKTRANLPILRFISRLNKPSIIQLSNVYPGWDRWRGDRAKKWARVKDIINRLPSLNVFDSLTSRLPNCIMGIRPADFVIVGGRAGERGSTSRHLVGDTTYTIRAHAMDYETYLDNVEFRSEDGNMAVFIDEYLPYHIDNTELGQPMSPGPYFNKLRRLLDRVEEFCGYEIVIAACPRADYNDKPGLFGSRKIIYNSTAKLVAQSKLVIAHRSTAINFAVLFEKPILLVATRETYNHTSQTPYFDGFATALEKEIQFFDDPKEVDLSKINHVNRGVYSRYVEDFIKQSSSPEKNFWQIILDEVNGSGRARI